MRAPTLAGRWRIVEMELWDREAIDLMGPAFIGFGKNRTGEFRFIAVEGWMDCRHQRHDGLPHVEFTWEGSDEGDQVHGRGWAALAGDGTLHGRIFIHLGDDSGFRAVRVEEQGHPGTGTRTRAAGSRR